MSRFAPIRATNSVATRRLLRGLSDLIGPDADLRCTSSMPWASGLYDGTRHLIEIDVVGEDAAERADRMARMLPDTEFLLIGNIVADLTVDSNVALDAQHHRLELSVLTIADA
ncbi:hypothetical protein C1T17_15285 [Sphingobium sp. SCG-1]|uniref:hypothetical protein n=1 Tax=Sphingobium sp. SCG-1 TaxID=2072936 RepID=UPI000CD6A4C6|nr:hypothetical protein [Sphingobium sp. SCG-1]AUW59247.1 hypothetical protein C1T17_15285 [Sphingobium sp. SCG-1]